MMMKSHSSFLIVEGRRDELFFDKFRIDNCYILETNGKDNLVDTITILNDRAFSKALAIRDTDFDEILQKKQVIANLLYSDYHDNDIAIINTKTLYTIIKHIGTKEKITKFEELHGKNTILKFVLDQLQNLSKLKLANIIYSLGLKFKPKNDEKVLDFSKLFVKENLQPVNYTTMIDVIYQYSQGKSVGLKTKAEVHTAFNAIKDNNYDLLQLTNGHDIASLIHLGCQRLWGNNSRSDVSVEDIESKLILAFDSVEFSKTKLYNNIKLWESSNKTQLLTF